MSNENKFDENKHAVVIFRFFGNVLSGIAHVSTISTLINTLALTKHLSTIYPGTFILGTFIKHDEGNTEVNSDSVSFNLLIGCEDGKTIADFSDRNNVTIRKEVLNNDQNVVRYLVSLSNEEFNTFITEVEE